MSLSALLLFALHAISTGLYVFNFEWTPASGPVTAYEVEVLCREFATLPSSEYVRDDFVVSDTRASVIPTFYETCRIRVRGIGGIPSSTDGCPYEICGEWSEVSDPVSRINNIDANGDGIIGLAEYLAISILWGAEIDDSGVYTVD